MKQGDVIAVLKEAGKPLSAKEILEHLRARGVDTPHGKTPEMTLAASIYVDIKRKGEASPFGKVEKKALFFAKDAALPAPVASNTTNASLDKEGNRKTGRKRKADTSAKTSKGRQKGYVYILTNPSFNGDCVKIGRSKRPVDVRSKELDNTSMPTPYEIFATIETTMYNEVEKLVHDIIDGLTDLRIRKNREFFNVSPQKALAIFRSIAPVVIDAKLVEYADNKPIKQAVKKTGKKTPPAPRTERRRPRFKFSMIGVKVGETVTFVPSGIQVKVASDATVEYKGRIYKLAPFVRKHMPKRQRNNSGAYQGAKYFTYKGKILDDLRTEREGRS